jgi:hypothetical protein
MVTETGIVSTHNPNPPSGDKFGAVGSGLASGVKLTGSDAEALGRYQGGYVEYDPHHIDYLVERTRNEFAAGGYVNAEM